jgi:nitroimidazol reductase NimA-like FMN-containing flavoprotein (pyridoxamine 5'-phosphate oxidase superfamily)
MLEITDMERDEIVALLLRVPYGHLACARDNHPYVVPMHYAYDSECLYFFTTEGTKTEMMAANSEVCFQVEEVDDAANWRSAQVTGRAERLTRPEDTERAMSLITGRNPSLQPAINRTEVGAWKRLNNIVMLRVRQTALYGRKTA